MARDPKRTIWMSGHSCLACGDSMGVNGYKGNKTVPCSNCGFQPPASVKGSEWDFAIKVRDATIDALENGKHWLNRPPFNFPPMTIKRKEP